MSDGDRQAPRTTESPAAGESAPPQEHWFDKLRAAVGLKGGTIREDLAVALATEDVASGFSREERAMLGNILRLREVRVDDIMVPRADIEAVDISLTLGDLLGRFRDSGHSRMPVFRDSLDDPVGLIHIKDLMGYFIEVAGGSGDTQPLDFARVDLSRKLSETALVRNILFVPPSMPVAVLLPNMQASRMHMALVIDEYGGTDGLVSIEDAVEMIVGEISDESDEDTGPMIVPDGKGGFLADARAELSQVAEVTGEDFAKGETGEDVDTLGGLVFELTGRIPVRGELVAAPGGYEFEILDADPRRIKRLRLYRRRPAGERARRQRPPSEGGGPAQSP
jgi:CBS domain containing-hemolysin-like protein